LLAASAFAPRFLLLLLVGAVVGLVFLLHRHRIPGRAIGIAVPILAGLFVLAVHAASRDSNAIGVVFFLGLISAIALLGWVAVRFFRPARSRARQLGRLRGWFGEVACPPVGRLKDLLAERVPPPERARLAAHLDACPACQHRLEGLTAGKELWPAMARHLTEPPPPPGPALKQVMDSLKGPKDAEATQDRPVFRADLPLGFLSPPDKPGQLGRLDRYEVLAEVGRGGMGVVLKAFDPSLHRVVAIKVLAPELATSGVARKRFLREAKAVAAVTHEHIVTIHAVDEANGLPYLVMQYVAGMSLQERLDKDGPLEVKEVVRIGLQTAAGLAAAHAQGIVHRDIKPANILLEDGVQRVKITDFGLARAMDDASLTQSGFVAGSPQYMAPEQARGEGLDHRADLFSLGSVLYTACTGRAPFRAANTLAVLRRVAEDTPRPVRETNPEVPDWLAAVIEKLHAKDPAERFQSAAEVVEVFGQHLAQLQLPGWAPPPAPSPQPAGATAGLPTSLTICPSCGAHLHVPERMVGGLVHCAECGKPFRAEDGSEVIQVARAVPPPFGRRPRPGKKVPVGVWIGAACAVFLVVLLLFTLSSPRHAGPVEGFASVEPRSPQTPATQPLPEPFWKTALRRFPAEATLFGAVNLKAFGSFNLDDEWTRTVFRLGLSRLGLPAGVEKMLTPENLGRVQIDGVSLAYYDSPKEKGSRYVVQIEGLAQDGRRRGIDLIRQTIRNVEVEEDRNPNPSWPDQPTRIRVTGPELPFAVGAIDDYRVFLAGYLDGKAKGSQHGKVLEELPEPFSYSKGRGPQTNFLSGYNPPWLRAALGEIPPNAFGLLMGEIPAEVRNLLTEALELRECPRTFVCYLKRKNQGVTLSLTLNMEKAGAELLLRDDLEKWRQQGLQVLKARFPRLKVKPGALRLLGHTLQTMRWGTNPGSRSVRTYVQINGPTWRALGDLVKLASQPPDEGKK
jgi:serine/threonine-protein kinase